ncbi:transcriptional regulator [Opitutaceae bacterium TAV1]|nr:transcriptional regulator [Opitutaceae bacterium TAV1]
MKKPSLPQRLAVALLSEIASGNYCENTRFLSRREIMRQWKVSSPTATDALRILAGWGILHPNDRSGHHLRPQFLQKTLLRINKTSLSPLPGQPRLDDKARALLHANRPLGRIAVVSVCDHIDPLAATRHDNVPAVPLSLPIKIPAKIIFSEANEVGVTVDFYFDDGCDATRRQILGDLPRSRPQGVIILRRLMSAAVSPLATPLIKAGIPVVTAFDDCENLRMVSVNFNNVGLGYTAARQFLAAGHRRIAVALPLEEEAPWYYRDRYHGCELAAREHIAAYPGDTVTITPVAVSLHPRQTPARRLLALFDRADSRRPTALLSTSVNLLVALQPLFVRLGLHVPADLSVIMCSSTPVRPPEGQPTDIMKLDFEEIGRQAFRALQSLYRGEFAEKTWLVESGYEAHGTVAPPPAA